jgi:hypothetical protein
VKLYKLTKIALIKAGAVQSYTSYSVYWLTFTPTLASFTNRLRLPLVINGSGILGRWHAEYWKMIISQV